MTTQVPGPSVEVDLRLDIPQTGDPVVTKHELATFILRGKDAVPLCIPYRTIAAVALELGIPTTGWIYVRVNSVQAEDGSGESWNVEGYASFNDPMKARHVTIYTRTDRPTGVIMFR